MSESSPTLRGRGLCVGALCEAIVADVGVARAVIDEVGRRVREEFEAGVWIALVEEKEMREQLRAAMERRERGMAQPLLGVPFAVKDNIDVAGMATTVGCKAFEYRPTKSAGAVRRLVEAGAILVGKTNLDQFATGLVGTRSPFGMPRNPFDERYIPGGSSSGSAVAVARGWVSFALGTDTAGSGRVPAGFNNIVGLKPTRGFVSTAGVFPACRSLDCVSIFAMTCDDADRVYRVVRGHDAEDAYSRASGDVKARRLDPRRFRFGIPAAKGLEFFGDEDAKKNFREVARQLEALGGEKVEIDFSPFARAARLLYEGPWVAERYAAVGDFLESPPDAMLPVTREIISRGKNFSAAEAFRAQDALGALRQEARGAWEKMDVLVTPTSGTIYTLAQVAADPIGTNTNLGYYTNFANLMDLAAVAVPTGMRADGLPGSATLIGQAGTDEDLLALGDRVHRAMSRTLGATEDLLAGTAAFARRADGWVKLAVVGAHLSGQPLNFQLTNVGARLVRACRTSDSYRLFALAGTVPPKPGLIRAEAGGVKQKVEVWEMSPEAFGLFVAAIPPPLGVGTIRLEDGEEVKSFLCEQYATMGARDISSFGGWEAFLASR